MPGDSATWTPPPEGVVLIATKLHVPGVRPGSVARDRLVARLTGGGDRRLALVCAPAGWGKTSLLAEWHASAAEPRPFAWVSLDPSDDVPVRFWSYVVGALRSVVPGFGGAVLAALPNAGPALIDAVLPKLINELALLPGPLVLVLDDYHVVNDELIHGSVEFMLRHMPPTLQLALTSRVDPPLPLARLRAAGELVEVRAAELRFDAAEASALLNGSHALDLGAGDVELLHERTEGWPAGLQLAALSLRDRDDGDGRAEFVRSLAGDDRQIGDYLQEVIAGAPRGMREFLLRTSILERVCAPLCDAVTGGGDGAVLLAEAYRSNLFLVALDERGYWYRYHALFRDLLRRQLARSEPELVGELHARAAAWHDANGDVEDAIVHAIAAGAMDRACALVRQHWRQTWDVSPRTVELWLSALPQEAVLGDGTLCLAAARVALFTGRLDDFEEWLDAAERTPLPRPPPDELGSFDTNVACLRSALAHTCGDVDRACAMASRAWEARAGGPPSTDAFTNMLLGMTRYFRGDEDGVIAPLEQARAAVGGLGWGQVLLTTFAVLTLAHADREELALAEQRAADAERLIDDLGLGEAPTASLACSARGRLLELSGELDGAEAAYERAALLARRTAWPLDLALALLLHAGLKRRCRDFAAARLLTREARRALSPCPDPGMLAGLLDRTERALQLGPARGAGPAPADGADLSEREIAVLRLLATDLSQREIGAELYVSVNTVKTHTRTLFRKLGVASRADAVASAREIGLL